jgi:hypothetical protein
MKLDGWQLNSAAVPFTGRLWKRAMARLFYPMVDTS